MPYQAPDGAAYEAFLGRRARRPAEPLLDFSAFADDGALLDVGCGILRQPPSRREN